MTRARMTLAALAGCLALGGCSEPDVSDLREFVANTKASAPGKPLPPLPEPPVYHPFTYAAQDLKSPFEVSAFVRTPVAPKIDNGIRPDLDRPREELEKYALSSLKMVGTIEREGRWALILAPDGSVQPVAPGNHMGADYGKVTAVLDDRVELLEIVPDGQGGWAERRNALSLQTQ